MPKAREQMHYDVLIVGAGPAGLACAIRLKQLAIEKGREISVCLIDKGAEVGAHLLSGAVLDPRALTELFPNLSVLDAPLNVRATHDSFYFLTEGHAFRLPTPPQMKNHGAFIISLGRVARWMAAQAENLGVEIYAGFAAAEVLYDESGKVVGVATGDVGMGKNGEPTDRFAAGVELRATQTVIAEGCRGSLTQKLFEGFKLRAGVSPQTYGLGLKEIWEIDPARHRTGSVQHTIGWPMDRRTYGGSWLYHWEKNLVSIGFVVGLDYENPYLSPFEEFQRFKNHPHIAAVLQGGKRLSYGARALSEGGLQSLPRLTFPGGLLIGDAAGFLNVPRIKGNHTAMKSGMVAAEALIETLATGAPEALAYRPKLEASWLWDELVTARNIRPSFRAGLWGGLLYSALDTVLLRGRAPWTFSNHTDHTALKQAKDCAPIAYPKPDGILSFDRLSSVFLSNTAHEENQPAHLWLKDPRSALDTNLKLYDSPESRYCPAAVYEIVRDGAEPRLQINAQNCLHCKTCDIKDPTQNIIWTVPEGGGGPNYQDM